MPGAPEHETGGTGEDARAPVCRFPRRDVVLERGNEIRRYHDLPEVDRHTAQRDAAGYLEPVGEVHLAKVEAVHLRRHARGIGIPVKEIEREGILPEQIVVDDERRHQVVRAQHVEGGRHLGALEVAALPHAAFQVLDLRIVDEHPELARDGKIEQRREERRRGGAPVVPLRHPRERGAEQRPSEAVTDDVDLVLAGRLADRIERR